MQTTLRAWALIDAISCLEEKKKKNRASICPETQKRFARRCCRLQRFSVPFSGNISEIEAGTHRPPLDLRQTYYLASYFSILPVTRATYPPISTHHDSALRLQLLVQNSITPKNMQIASILSDLNSLRVCDHTAALALVNAKPSSSSSPSSSSLFIPPESIPPSEKDDIDLCRATDLLELHYGVKMKHVQARREGGVAGGIGGGELGEIDKGLRQARKDVDGVLKRLKKGEGL